MFHKGFDLMTCCVPKVCRVYVEGVSVFGGPCESSRKYDSQFVVGSKYRSFHYLLGASPKNLACVISPEAMTCDHMDQICVADGYLQKIEGLIQPGIGSRSPLLSPILIQNDGGVIAAWSRHHGIRGIYV